MDKYATRINSIVELYEKIPADQRIIVDILRRLISENIPYGYKEKLAYNVPLFYGRRSICIIWPAAIPRGGIKAGVLLGFWYGNMLPDPDHYLEHGTNKQVYYKVFIKPEDIDEHAVVRVLKEAVRFDEANTKKSSVKKMFLLQGNEKPC